RRRQSGPVAPHVDGRGSHRGRARAWRRDLLRAREGYEDRAAHRRRERRHRHDARQRIHAPCLELHHAGSRSRRRVVAAIRRRAARERLRRRAADRARGPGDESGRGRDRIGGAAAPRARLAPAEESSVVSRRVVVFDLGGVLLNWDPRHLYRKLFPDEASMEAFLAEVCPVEWNERQDAGRPFAEAVAELAPRHPDKLHLINAWYERFGEMIPGAIDGTVEILRELKSRNVP